MKRIFLIVLASFILVLCACTSAGSNPADDLPVERIVSGYYISSSMCIALGLSDRLVGIEARAETRPIYAMAAPQLLELPNVGTARDFNLEACLALNPDLVILPSRLRDVADTLTEMDIAVILVNPESFGEIIEMMDLVGKAAGVGERATQLITFIESTHQELHALTADIIKKPTVYVSGVGSWLTTAPKDMFQSSLVEMAGGLIASREIEENSWIEISYEQLLAMNPEVILIPAEASYEIEDILSDSAISQIDAVKNNRIYQMPSHFEAWDSPIPASMLGAKWLLNTLHPDVYSDESLQNAIAGFYAEFYGITS